MDNSLETWLENVENSVIKVPGFSGIGIVNYGDGEKIEIAVLNHAAKRQVLDIIHRPDYAALPISVIVTDKTTPL